MRSISRRVFLKKLMAVLGVPVVVPLLEACAPDTSGPTDLPTTDHVLIIGAGMSGLAAAAELKKKGVTVTVIEGRDRIGGRVFTSNVWQGAPVDLGASWIHGVDGNPLTTLADALGVERVETDYESQSVFDADGNLLSDAELTRIEDNFNTLIEALDALRESRLEEELPDISLQEAIDQVLAEEEYDPDEVAELSWAINTVIEHEFAADARDLSFYSFDEGEEIVGADVVFPQGYRQLIDALAEGLTIRTGEPVEAITVLEDKVQVTTTKGVIEGDRVLVTLPLGILKRGDVTFEPALPTEKLQSISRLDMGVLNKLYLKFPNAFWSSVVEDEFIDRLSDEPGHWAESLNFYAYTGAPILLMFNAGTFGTELESWTDQEIVADAMSALRSMFGSTIPEPSDYQLTRWKSDPFCLGSYSHLPPGALPEDRDTLAEPVGTRLFFAGEATYSDFPSTVHGAYLSGVREAQRWGGSEVQSSAPQTRRRTLHQLRRTSARLGGNRHSP